MTFTIPEANINTVYWDGKTAAVTLQPGDATNYVFGLSGNPLGTTVMTISSPQYVPMLSIYQIDKAQAVYDDEIIRAVARRIGHLHTAAIIVLATKWLLRHPDDIMGAAKYAMSVRHNRYY